MPRFRITHGKGFHITFKNGWTISVQFGNGNYCQHHDSDFSSNESRDRAASGSYDAEVAAWPNDSDGKMVEWPEGGTVRGYVSPDYVAKVIAYLAALKEGEPFTAPSEEC